MADAALSLVGCKVWTGVVNIFKLNLEV